MVSVNTKPWSRAQVRNAMDADGCIHVIVSVSLDVLVDRDLEGLNDYVEERILDASSSEAALFDLSFNVVGHQSVEPFDKVAGEVLIRVDACVELAGNDELTLYRIAFRPVWDGTAYKWCNHYVCPSCGYEWSDAWSSQVDDDCPACKQRHVSPTRSEETQTEARVFTWWAASVEEALAACQSAHPDADVIGLADEVLALAA